MTFSDKPDPRILLKAGITAHKAGEHKTARQIYQQVLRLYADHPHALHLLGVLTDAEGRYDEAVCLIRRALPALDRKANVHNNLGTALRHAGQPADARRHYERALALDGNYSQAHHNLGVLLAAEGPEEDLVSAREHLRRAVGLQPDLADAWLELARLNRREGKLPAAIETLRRVLELRPDDVAALVDLGVLYQLTLEVSKAIPLLERACELAPDAALPRFNLAQALAETGEGSGPSRPTGGCWRSLPRGFTAVSPWPRPDGIAATGRPGTRRRWGLRTWTPRRSRRRQPPSCSTSTRFRWPSIVRWHGRTRNVSSSGLEELGGPLPRRPAEKKARLRLGFLSADLRHHPVGHLCHGLFACLDRDRFDAFAYSLIPVDDAITAQARAGCDLFRDCARWGDRAIARQIADDAIDILVDLTGYTTYSRPVILALRPAPLQLQHMGYLNTMGASFIDYQVSDSTVVGPVQRPFFDEALIFLPDCLFPVSPLGALAATSSRPTRASEGLPADHPVLCSFNGPSKLDPPTFDAWMTILRQAPNAVLWLFDGDEPRLPTNLRREAEARGVEPARLVFASKVPYADHLQRYRLADLFLDAFTYNGGATAVDALREGLPVLTRLGETPLARMGASVVRAGGLGDLVATSTEGYIQTAVKLAGSRDRMRDLAARTEAARQSAELFDLDRWVRHMRAG